MIFFFNIQYIHNNNGIQYHKKKTLQKNYKTQDCRVYNLQIILKQKKKNEIKRKK